MLYILLKDRPALGRQWPEILCIQCPVLAEISR